ncbi:MAG: sigma-70 family RNA polymerase sigma factor [Actinobacteria bacterium]|nr:sigma-70 family RNA polymerase sigma factor [Actinomycetota bacterium]
MAIEPRRDNAAITEQYPATFHRLQRMFRARGIPREEAADLAQETATRLLIHLDRHGQIDGRDDPTPLINRIATNLMIDRARSSARRVISLDAMEEERPHADTLEDQVARRQHKFLVRRAMRELNERQRLAIALSLDGLTPAEIANALGLERNAADALLHRARRRLGERLRSMQRELHGLGVVGLLRLRAVGRRAVDSAERVAVAAPALAPAMSAAIVLALGGSSAPAPVAIAAAPVAVIRAVSVPAAPAGHLQPAQRAAVSHAAPSSSHLLSVPHAKVQTQTKDPITGRSGPTGVEVWRETGQPGVPGAAELADCLASPADCSIGK